MNNAINDENLRNALAESICVLQPYEKNIVLVGGMATFFYPLLSGYVQQQLSPVATTDIDFAISKRVQSLQAGSISTLLESVGFEKQTQLGSSYSIQNSNYFIKHKAHDAKNSDHISHDRQAHR